MKRSVNDQRRIFIAGFQHSRIPGLKEPPPTERPYWDGWQAGKTKIDQMTAVEEFLKTISGNK